jgi:hypothetical protein
VKVIVGIAVYVVCLRQLAHPAYSDILAYVNL